MWEQAGLLEVVRTCGQLTDLLRWGCCSKGQQGCCLHCWLPVMGQVKGLHSIFTLCGAARLLSCMQMSSLCAKDEDLTGAVETSEC